ncbi:unnamed protein product [Musa hybrid cultivar]
MAGGSESEPAKVLLPYLQRADELQKHEPIVTYYCRLYAMDRGLKIPKKERTKTTDAILVSLMNQLEKDKKSLKLGPDDNLYVEGFASNLFAKADKQDRAGRADLNTARTFYAASIFFEILNQFGKLHPEIEQKQKYAVWKAVDIRKALKEGRKPEPGPPGGDDVSTSPRSTCDLGPSESFPSSQPGGDTSSPHINESLGRSKGFQNSHGGADLSSQHSEIINTDFSSQAPSTTYATTEHPTNGLHQFPPTNRPEYTVYPRHYDPRSYPNEQQPVPQNYHSPKNPSPNYCYHNFQSCPSYHDSTFPAAPTHQPAFHHGPDVASSHHSAPSFPNYPSTVPFSGNGNGNVNHAVPPAPSVENYKYDSNYQPSVEKIGEAHKAARFAVGALGFDDVPVAVDFLRRSLELLTNPSAEIH